MPLKKEAEILAKTIKILIESQIGHGGRQIGQNISNIGWKALIGAEPINRPFDGDDTPKSKSFLIRFTF
jgi:hypothetical protein